jgi:hypothetical protein
MLLVIPDGAVALGAGTVLALGAAAVVLGPLLRDDVVEPPPNDSAPSRAEPTGAVDALREIEFDRATGKLSDADYAALKATYTRQALAELRARDAAPAVGGTSRGLAVADDPLEQAIRGFRRARRAVCPVDGVRPEPDALFCSSCGRYLRGHCPVCGAACEAEEQRFCGACGASLAAAAASR